MTIAEIKSHLQSLEKIGFLLPNGELVAPHFHVTEVGIIEKRFIDCGGVMRKETKANFQLWEENDYDHRLHPEKLSKIIELSQNKLGIHDELEIEVEYQGVTIGKYALDFDGINFTLVSTQTACLAKDACGVPVKETMVDLSTEFSNNQTCTPGSGCC